MLMEKTLHQNLGDDWLPAARSDIRTVVARFVERDDLIVIPSQKHLAMLITQRLCVAVVGAQKIPGCYVLTWKRAGFGLVKLERLHVLDFYVRACQ
jgi:hypothetical protein